VSAIADLVPEAVKAALRPAYRRIVQGWKPEANTNLAIRSVGNFDIAHRAGTADEIIIGNMANYDLPNLVPGFIPNSSDVIINIGAHIGVFVLTASASAPQGEVHAIEAASDNFNFLRVNIALNKANNIRAHKIAIAAKNGPVKLYFDIWNWGHSITKQLSTRTEEVEGLTLKDFFDQSKIQRCDLMYLNCEGAEFPILLNTPLETLKKIEFIAADCHPHLWKDNTVGELVSYLDSCGFRATLHTAADGNQRVVAINGHR
jgi:FkbM family methyltransferase